MTKPFLPAAAASLLCLLSPSAPAVAQEVFAGGYVHGVETPFTFDTGEGGVDIAAGYRLQPIEALGAIGKPAPYVIASLNTRGDTSFAGGGLGWKVGKGPLYFRPAVGMVVHDGPSNRVDPFDGKHTELGSRVLFELEAGLGYRLDPKWSVEASWMHISHAQLFNSQQNPGIDMMGLRLAYRLH